MKIEMYQAVDRSGRWVVRIDDEMHLCESWLDAYQYAELRKREEESKRLMAVRGE